MLCVGVCVRRSVNFGGAVAHRIAATLMPSHVNNITNLKLVDFDLVEEFLECFHYFAFSIFSAAATRSQNFL